MARKNERAFVDLGGRHSRRMYSGRTVFSTFLPSSAQSARLCPSGAPPRRTDVWSRSLRRADFHYLLASFAGCSIILDQLVLRHPWAIRLFANREIGRDESRSHRNSDKRELRFRRAAQRLHVSHPALSQQIQDLEDKRGQAKHLRRSKTTLAAFVDSCTLSMNLWIVCPPAGLI
jgi:Bacterial regulatory helix-turn-helix protein, lysR family